VAGGTVYWEVDMGKGAAGDHQPATVRSSHHGGPVRATVIAGHRGDVDAASRLARHRDPAVRAAALGALHRLGALDTSTLAEAITDPDPTVRRRACALAGRSSRSDQAGPPRVEVLVAALSSDTDASVVEVAAWGLGELGSRCGPSAVEALEGVARGHADPLCREAAVAALGAVGDSRSLETVLGALQDKLAIRRRAVIALAAFDDPRVDEAWRRCLEDRDWQVRQAAEDLSGRP
jgi:HEAT repeat protein